MWRGLHRLMDGLCDVLQALADNLYGLIGLVVIAVSVLAILLLPERDDVVRTIAFFVLAVGAGLLIRGLLRHSSRQGRPEKKLRRVRSRLSSGECARLEELDDDASA